MTDTDAIQTFRSLLSEGDLTCTVSDALGRTQALSADFRPVWPGARLAGRAVTVRTFGTDLSAVFDGVRTAEADAVLVIDTHGIRNAAFWGERTALAARARGLAGTVIDGACRDVSAMARLQYPVFSTAITPNAGLPGGRGQVNVPVQIGGVPVQPGDLVIADENGVVIVPATQLTTTLERVQQLLAAEDEARAAATLGEAVLPT